MNYCSSFTQNIHAVDSLVDCSNIDLQQVFQEIQVLNSIKGRKISC